MADYFESYGDLAVHRLMIQDDARTAAYLRAIEAIVEPGDTVLDVGAGSGILSLFAARCGAGHVHAVDQSKIIEVARDLAADNGFAERMSFHRELVEDVVLEPKADVLVSEWFGYFALAETMFKSFVQARDANLKPAGRTIPASFSLHLAPLESEQLYRDRGPGLWEQPVYGLDFTRLIDLEIGDLEATSVVIPPETLLGPAVELVDVDCHSATTADFFDPLTRNVEDMFVHGSTPYPIERTLLTSGMVIGGVETTLPLHRRLVEATDVIDGNYDIHWLEKYLGLK